VGEAKVQLMLRFVLYMTARDWSWRERQSPKVDFTLLGAVELESCLWPTARLRAGGLEEHPLRIRPLESMVSVRLQLPPLVW
jgi:hypothetical protein